ncbi:serine hydrolase domain-containing protein [Aspergillus thermomutatus]|uniref:Beta-lactamase-related domain-containing protein n=1 Tax=Aspergillus thermomutatus TaxID=41047 RepID=A0A397GBJ6_ASPTH|nr:uncharacterized protein CDV56_102589 [Aspergillus thermomutatus]RHZ45470.1 hypothetical protein CDV56_102589 [Aspergillus thermomutatus]
MPKTMDSDSESYEKTGGKPSKDILEPAVLFLSGQSVLAEAATSTPLYQLNSDIRSISNKDSSVAFGRVEHDVPELEIEIKGVTAGTPQEIYDTKKATEKLAAQAPWWIPGESSGYHLTNQGHLVGEIIRRITGKPLEQFVADEITGPLGADFQYGVPEEHWSRTADVISPPALPFSELDPQSITAKAIAGSPFPAEASMTPGSRKTVSGANNGFSNARALARIGSIVSLDGILDENKRIISASTVEKMLTEQIKGTDIVTFDFLRFGLGVALPAPQTCAWIPEGRIGFWGGWGGSMIIMDRDRRMTIGYVMNNMSGSGTLGNDNTEAIFASKSSRVLVDGCACGLGRQDARHVLIACPPYAGLRFRTVWQHPRETDYARLLREPGSVQRAARFMIATGLLGQFRGLPDTFRVSDMGGDP